MLDNFKDISFYLKNIRINKLINNRYLSFIFVLFKFKLFNSLITDQKISIKISKIYFAWIFSKSKMV